MKQPCRHHTENSNEADPMNESTTYRPELVVHVVWHPDFAAEKEVAGFVYDQFRIPAADNDCTHER